jgi:hypothetical protein
MDLHSGRSVKLIVGNLERYEGFLIERTTIAGTSEYRGEANPAPLPALAFALEDRLNFSFLRGVTGLSRTVHRNTRAGYLEGPIRSDGR